MTSRRSDTRSVQQVKALLEKNVADANTAVDTYMFWVQQTATRYRDRAELLSSTYTGTGDEHAVLVLLTHDKTEAEKAYARESHKSHTKMSGEGYVHRDAIGRYARIVWKTRFFSFLFFPGAFFHSRVIGACPVTTGLIIYVEAFSMCFQ